MTDNWVERGQEISSADDLRAYVSDLRNTLRHLETGLARGTWGVLAGRSWLDTPGDQRPNTEALLELVDMGVTPAGMSARAALYRQSLATLLAALDATDRAALAAWLAHVNDQDPDKTA
jgi:hypothetical protein